MKKIGLVTITFNGASVIEEFIESVNNLTYGNYVLYVIDNNSQDDTLRLIDRDTNHEKTVIIKNYFNNGVAGGNNQGIKQGLADGCDHIILINNDTVFEPTLLEKLLEASEKSSDAIVAPKIMYHSEPNIIWFAGGYFDKSKGYLNYHIGDGEEDNGQYKSYTKIDYAPTCCTLIPKTVFDNIGFMDEKYFVYFDDTDFFFRMMKDGRHSMIYLNEVSFYHKVGSITKSKQGTRKKFKFGDFSIKFKTRNQVYFLRKQRNIYSTFYIFILYFRTNLRFLFSGKYHLNLKTFGLIQKSFFQGLKL